MRLAAILVIVLATRCAWAQCPPQTVVGSDTAQYDRFGQSVSVNEDVIVVGAREAEQSYVYEWLDASASWTEVSILGPSQSSITPTHFGRTVAVEGDVIAVGAPSHNTSEGRVYVFEKSGSNWVETAALTSSVNPIITTQFGRCVAIDDERIFVGRIYGFPSARHAIHVFERNGAEWQETHTFAPTGETRRFGEAIAVDGNRALVGAPDGTFSNGSAFVFEYIGNEWVEQQELLVSGNEQIVGYRVALDGDTALVSAQYGAVASGSVYVFERDPQSGVWSEQDKFESASSGLLGSSTALSNEIAFISEATSDVAGDYAGAVHRFDRRGSTWTLSNTIYPNPGDGQTFGAAMAGDEDLLVIGAPGADYARIESRNLGGTYCQVNPNSTEMPAEISAYGACSVDQNELTLRATQLPPNKFGYFLLSQSQGFFPNPGGSDGNLCIGGPIGRFQAEVQSSGGAGVIAISVDLSNIPLFGSIVAGETWNFTCWYRDVGGASNFTGGLTIPFN